MRRLIESLTPDNRQIYWRWVSGMFALYVVLMITAAGVFIRHEPARTVAHEGAATVAIDRSLAPSHPASVPARQAMLHY